MVDRLGSELTAGCTVAYPGRQGSRCWTSTGTVVETDEGDGARRLPRVKVVGGGHEPDKPELGTRWVGFDRNVIVVRPK